MASDESGLPQSHFVALNHQSDALITVVDKRCGVARAPEFGREAPVNLFLGRATLGTLPRVPRCWCLYFNVDATRTHR